MKTIMQLTAMTKEELREESSKYFNYVKTIDAMIELYDIM